MAMLGHNQMARSVSFGVKGRASNDDGIAAE